MLPWRVDLVSRSGKQLLSQHLSSRWYVRISHPGTSLLSDCTYPFLHPGQKTHCMYFISYQLLTLLWRSEIQEFSETMVVSVIILAIKCLEYFIRSSPLLFLILQLEESYENWSIKRADLPHHQTAFPFRSHLCSTVTRSSLSLSWTHTTTRPWPWGLSRIFGTEEETQEQVPFICMYLDFHSPKPLEWWAEYNSNIQTLTSWVWLRAFG